MFLLAGRGYKPARRGGENKDDVLKSSSCGSSTDGSAAMDVDGVPRGAAGRRRRDEEHKLWIILCAGKKLMWTEVELKGWYGSVDGDGMWREIMGIRERLTPGPLTLLSISPKI